MPFTIAIDGPAASGKGTIARALAQRFGFLHLDTGLLYRAVGAMGGDPVAAARALTPDDLLRPGLRSAEAGQAASRVAAIPEVRAVLVDFQRRFAVQDIHTAESSICRSGEVLQGLLKPHECAAFGRECTPHNPLGATMVSSEGACAAYHRYRRLELTRV